MGMGLSNGWRVRFGAFEADLQAGELRKSGIRVRLQDQPFRVLALLLERSGEVVSREDLRQEIWPDDTFVDFDHSLNTAINKIREALGDSATHPRFVETIPRRGYRFVFPVEGLVSTQKRSQELPSSGSGAHSRASWKARWALVSLVLAVAAAFAIWGFFGSSDSGRTPVPDYDFTPLTRDSGLTRQPALSPDGRLVAYASDRDGQGGLDIYVQQVGSTEAVRLTDHPADDWFPSFSPDGTQVVFRSERGGGGIYLVRALGGNETLLVSEGRSPRFSPDGQWIAYWKGLGIPTATSIHVVATTGGPPAELETDVSHASTPLWSPDGTHLMFWGWEKKEAFDRRDLDLYVAPREGGKAIKTGFAEVVAVAGLRYLGGFPVGSGANNKGEWLAVDHSYVFDAVSAGGALNVWQVPISPKTYRVVGPPRQLTRGTNEWEPAVARNGRIAFVEREVSVVIWSVAIDGNQGKILGDPQREVQGGLRYGWPDVSADGRQLVFDSDRSGNWDVWIKDLVSGKERPVLATAADERRPRISPDGSKVAVERGPGYRDLLVIPSGGGEEERLREGVVGLSSWSPDSRRLLYQSAGTGSILTVDVSTREEIEVLPGQPDGWLAGATLSPDDAWISFHFPADQSPRTIYIAPLREGVAADRAEWVEIKQVETPTRHWWSPDANLLYFLWGREGPYEVWAQRLDDTTKRPRGDPFQVKIPLGPQLRLTGHTYGLTTERLYMLLRQTTGNIWLAETAAAP